MSFPNPYTSTLNDLLLAVLNHLGTKTEFEPRDIPNVYNDTTNDLLLSILAKITESSGKAWELGGNTIGTESNKLGTIDDKDLEIIRNNIVALSLVKDVSQGYTRHLLNLMPEGFSVSDKGDMWLKTQSNNGNSRILEIIYDYVNQITNMRLGLGFNSNTGFNDTLAFDADVYLPQLPNATSLATDADGKIIAGSGGGGIDDVLAQNQLLTENRIIDLNGNSLEIIDDSDSGIIKEFNIGDVNFCVKGDANTILFKTDFLQKIATLGDSSNSCVTASSKIGSEYVFIKSSTNPEVGLSTENITGTVKILKISDADGDLPVVNGTGTPASGVTGYVKMFIQGVGWKLIPYYDLP